MASSSGGVRSKVPSARRVTGHPGDEEWNGPAVNGSDGDLYSMLRIVLDKVLRNESQLSGMERKVEGFQTQMSEMNRKIDIIMSRFVSVSNIPATNSDSEMKTSSTVTSSRVKEEQNVTSVEIQEDITNIAMSSFPVEDDSNVNSVESEVHENDDEVMDSIQPERLQAEVVADLSKEMVREDMTPDLPGRPEAIDSASEVVGNKSVEVLDLGTDDSDQESEASIPVAPDPTEDREIVNKTSTNRHKRLNFGRGKLQTRPESPPPATPRVAQLTETQLKRSITQRPDDNRITYLGEVAAQTSGQGNTGHSSPDVSDEEGSSLESGGPVLNNQMTAPSGFKNEHGDEDNRSQVLTNVQRLRDGPRKPADGEPTTETEEERRKKLPDIALDEELHTLIETSRIAAKECDDVKSDGLDTVICLDTSDSMSGQPFQQAVQLIKNLLDGFEKNTMEHDLEENVALVTFGKQTRIMCHLTNDYGSVRDQLDELSAGGPSPLWLGLALALTEVRERGGTCMMESLTVMPRIILITDGFATTKNQLRGADINTLDANASGEVLTLYQMCYMIAGCVDCVVLGPCNEELLKVLSNESVFRPHDTKYLTEYFCVRDLVSENLKKIASGELNMKFLETLVENTHLTARGKGDMLRLLRENSSKPDAETEAIDATEEPQGGQKTEPAAESSVEASGSESFPENLFESPKETSTEHHAEPESELNTERLSEPSSKPVPQQPYTKPGRITDSDSEASLNSELEKPQPQPRPETTVEEQPESLQPSSSSLPSGMVDELRESEVPVFGALVVANASWESYDSKKECTGTVIGARKNGYIKVLWSDETIDKCRFGLNGQYDISEADGAAMAPEDDGKLRVGSLVERGKDWRWKDQDGGLGNVGVVIKIDGPVVHVIWPHGGQGNYRYGYNKKYDLQVCPRPKPEPRKYYAWYIQDLSKNWHMLPREVNESIEQMYNTKQSSSFLITMKSKQFRVSLDNMSACEQETKIIYPIERREISEEEWAHLIDPIGS